MHYQPYLSVLFFTITCFYSVSPESIYEEIYPANYPNLWDTNTNKEVEEELVRICCLAHENDDLDTDINQLIDVRTYTNVSCDSIDLIGFWTDETTHACLKNDSKMALSLIRVLHAEDEIHRRESSDCHFHRPRIPSAQMFEEFQREH